MEKSWKQWKVFFSRKLLQKAEATHSSSEDKSLSSDDSSALSGKLQPVRNTENLSASALSRGTSTGSNLFSGGLFVLVRKTSE